nr:RecName: Full=Mannose/glucose-specific lectin [Parkia platycephala]1ZGR_A Chain A, Mannose/glucose-specific lectin [Parkia platycephala]1ZGR_B Chain B, Mannose/glucose-specific lectin [Parkia platycephala]1ZGS_A Chain A, Mannose/glucose-specific lectin [Parkia platycephala]1ZGS_B Chain B, Mannose/glucose-specific lectin [Parkia platycephala]
SLKGMISVGPWGGSGGNYWSFKANHAITEIVIHVKDNIKSISFKDASGDISGTFGGKDPRENEKGDEKKIKIHWPTEYLKSISGSYGDYNGVLVIRSLSFITNLTTYGPFGSTSGGESFSIPIADSVVVGFHGRAGYYLDALGIFVQPVPHGTISFGPWGGPAGDDAFNFKVGSWIKDIIIYADAAINSIAFKDANGHCYGKFGGQDPNDIGVEKKVEIDGNLEHLKSISGTYGNYKGFEVVTSLSFITNVTKHGPFGIASGTSFSIPIEGSLVTGFHGKSGYYLDSIGIYVKPRDVEGSISIGPWGGSGGDPWSYTANEGINQIIIYAGSNIKSVAFKDTSGLDSATFGGVNPKDTGEKNTVSINWPSEYLTSISGTYGQYKFKDVFTTITSLSFTTNLATYGPFGKASATSFSIPIHNNMVVGFHGRAGDYLDAIGIFVKPDTAV